MPASLLLLTREVSDDTIRLVEALNRHGYYTIPAIARGVVSGSPDYLRRAIEEARGVVAVLLLSDSDDVAYSAKVVAQIAQLREGVFDLAVVNVLLPNASKPIVDGPVVHAATFSPVEISRMVAVIEASRQPARKEAPSLAIVWDPGVITPDEYAELVSAIGGVARAAGGTGIQRVDGGLLLAAAAVGVGSR